MPTRTSTGGFGSRRQWAPLPMSKPAPGP
jgi:hypothetical protein